MEYVVSVVKIHQDAAHAFVEIIVRIIARRKHFGQYEQEVADNTVG